MAWSNQEKRSVFQKASIKQTIHIIPVHHKTKFNQNIVIVFTDCLLPAIILGSK